MTNRRSQERRSTTSKATCRAWCSPTRRLISSLFIACWLAAPAQAAWALTPGLYELRSSSESATNQRQDLPVRKACLSGEPDADIAAIADRFDFDVSSCQTTASSVSGGRLLLQVQCASGDRRLTLNGNGTIADDGYSVTSDVAIKLDSTSIRLTTRTEATRVGDC